MTNAEGKWTNHFLIIGPLVAVCLGGLLAAIGYDQKICWTAGVTALVAFWWVTEPIPIPATSLLPFALFPLGGVVDHNQLAAAFGHHLILLLLGGFILSSAMERSGAHSRLALMMVKAVGGTDVKRLVLGFMIAAASLSMWISNTATTLMLLPIALAVLAQVERQEKLAVPLLLGIAYAANVGGMGTPVGTPPNVIFMSQYNAATGNEWTFLQWMKVGVPIVIVFVPIIWLWLTRGLELDQTIEIPDPGEWRPEERRVLVIFGITALLWVTRSEPNGGWSSLVASAWGFEKIAIKDSAVALFMAAVMFVVPNGKGGRLLDWETANKVPWGLLLLFSGGMAIGTAFKTSGLSDEIGAALSDITSLHVVLMMAIICLTITFLTEMTSNTATTNLMMPILAASCVQDGEFIVRPELLMIPAAISASCAFMLPVATAPNAIVFGTGGITAQRMVREGFALNLIGTVLITSICYMILQLI